MDEGQQVCFANLLGIESILSGVTGANLSNIFGKLEMAGAVNLFLVNPNGIVFGENAILDIPGSFCGTRPSSGSGGGHSVAEAHLPLAVGFDQIFNNCPGLGHRDLAIGNHRKFAQWMYRLQVFGRWQGNKGDPKLCVAADADYSD